ncbi:hypothetical protein BH23CHL8_BH23CHL8_08460 [soil metagenome]
MTPAPDTDVSLLLDGSVATLAQVCGTTDIAYRLARDSEEAGRLTFDAATTAAAACPDEAPTDPDITQPLGLVTAFSIQSDILSLLDDTAAPLLELEPPPLSGPEGSWRVAAFDPGGGELLLPLDGSVLGVSFQTDGRVEVTTGCRGFVGGYNVDGATFTMGVQGLARLGCPRRRYEEEIALSVALQSAVAWSGTSARLELRDPSGAPRVILRPQPRLTLSGNWRVERYARQGGELVEALEGSEPSVTFGPAERISGDTGCRTFSGGYFLDGDRIAIGTVQTAGVTCDDVRRRQERLLLRALEEATTWSRDGSDLRIVRADGTVLLDLVQAASPAPGRSAAPGPSAAPSASPAE